LIINRTGK